MIHKWYKNCVIYKKESYVSWNISKLFFNNYLVNDKFSKEQFHQNIELSVSTDIQDTEWFIYYYYI